MKIRKTLAGLSALLYIIQSLKSDHDSTRCSILLFGHGKKTEQDANHQFGVVMLSILVIEMIVHPKAFVGLMNLRGGGARFGLGSVPRGLKMVGGEGRRFTHGIIPIIVASLIVGWWVL